MVYGVLYKLVLPVNIWKAVAVINSLISGRLHCVFFLNTIRLNVWQNLKIIHQLQTL